MGRKRRGSGEGSVVPHNGRWKAIWTVSIKPRKTRTKTFGKRSEATQWLAQKQLERDAESKSESVQSDMLLSDWVTTWLSDVERQRATSTFEGYKHHAEKFIVPNLGSVPLRDLAPMAFRNLLSELESDYAEQRTLLEVYNVALRCMAAAEKMELISRNPVAQVSRPKYERKDIRPFTIEETRAILKQAESHRLHAMFVLAFSLGLRQGELFALEWSDIDWELRTIRIERQAVNNRGKISITKPKTKAGRRTLDLADNLVQALRERQALAMTEGHAANPVVFPAAQGGYIQRSSFATRHWKKILKACEIPERGLHHARHTFATHALTQGCPLHVVSKILGHSSPTVTLEAYSHLIDTAQRGTVEKVSQLFAG